MLDNLVMGLNHPSLSIYPHGVWWTFQSSGMLNWIYSEYSFYWCKIMVEVKH